MGSYERDVNPLIVPSSTHGLLRSSKDRGLKYRWRSIWIASIYLPLLIVPWILTCVMMYRPIELPSYINQVGEYTMADIDGHGRWIVAAEVLNRIASVLGVPAVSAILAQGAVVYAQRRKMGQELNIKQLFSLADRGWLDILILIESLRSTKSVDPMKPTTPKARTKYLWLGALLVLITAIKPPLQSILVPNDYITVPTCEDGPMMEGDGYWCGDTSGVVGRDTEPQQMEHCPQDVLVQRTLGNIMNVRKRDIQTNMWLERGGRWDHRNSPITHSFSWTYGDTFTLDADQSLDKYFVSPIVNGSTTGVLRQHAARMDSEATCVFDDSFPDECPGDRPFSTKFRSEYAEVSICAEGSFDKLPWTRSRDKQEITERLWLDLKVLPQYTQTIIEHENFTMRCDATSRRGWFELGNYQNGFLNQPMLERWPSSEVMETEFNDYQRYREPYHPVREEPPVESSGVTWTHPPNSFGTQSHIAAGPLMSAALALFGNTTFFYNAREAPQNRHFATAAAICDGNRHPFSMYFDSEESTLRSACHWTAREEEEDPELLSEIVLGFMKLFENPGRAKELLEIVMYFANEALLTLSTGGDLRTIYTSPGTQIVRPHKSLTGLVTMSVFIGLQAVGLALLLAFIYSTPAWTGYLDADAMVQVGAQLRDLDGGDDVIRAKSSGLVGAVESGERESSSLTEASGRKTGTVLSLGAPGMITKRLHQAEK